MCSWIVICRTGIIGLAATLAATNGGLAGPVCPGGLNHFGFSHCPEGQAQLNIADLKGDGDLELLVSNIGASGQDGVVLKKSDDDWIRELSVGFHDLLVGAPNGAYVKYELEDFEAGGTPGAVIMSSQTTRVADDWVLTWPQAPPGVTGYTVKVYDANGTLIASVSSVGAPTVTIEGAAASPGRWGYADESSIPNFFDVIIIIDLPAPSSVVITDSDGNASGPYPGNVIAIIADLASPLPEVDALRMTGANVGTMAIDDEAALFADGSATIFGLDHTPLGTATLSTRDDDCDGEIGDEIFETRVLTVCDIGSSGQDGVVLKKSDDDWIRELSVGFADLLAEVFNGAYLDFSVYRKMQEDDLEEKVASWRVIKVPPAPGDLPYGLSVDFSPLGSDWSYTLWVYGGSNRDLLYHETDRRNPLVGTLDGWPIGGGAEVHESILIRINRFSELRVTGGPTLIAHPLEIRMGATPPTPVLGLTSVELKAKDIPSLTITDEDFEILGGPAIPAVSTWGLVAMSLLMLTAGTVVARGHHASQASPPTIDA